MTNRKKDFDHIIDDYHFFEKTSTESAMDLISYSNYFSLIPEKKRLHLLDFGCGDGNFTKKFIKHPFFVEKHLEVSLMEPGPEALENAISQLKNITNSPIKYYAQFSEIDEKSRFDIILSNHVLYFVEDLESKIIKLINFLSKDGICFLSMASYNNFLIQLWNLGFDSINQRLPYNLTSDLENILINRNIQYLKVKSTYTLEFPNTELNKLKILRFLFGNNFKNVPIKKLSNEFEKHLEKEKVIVRPDNDIYIIKTNPVQLVQRF